MFEKSKIKKWLPFIIFTAVWLVLLLVATFKDLQISRAIAQLNGGNYYSGNVTGRFLESFGEAPLFVLFALALCFAARAARLIDGKILRVILRIGCVVCAVAAYALMTKRATETVCEHFNKAEWYESRKIAVWGISFIFGAAMSALTLFFTEKVKDENALRLFVWGIIVIATVILSQAIVFMLKPIFGRMRYRAIYVLEFNGCGDLANYTPWYVLSGKPALTDEMIALSLTKDAFKSFPSGHVSAGTVIITIAFLPEFISSNESNGKKREAILWVVSMLFVVILALSRVIMGAHFMSDVLIGGFITFISAIISRTVVKTLVKKHNLL